MARKETGRAPGRGRVVSLDLRGGGKDDDPPAARQAARLAAAEVGLDEAVGGHDGEDGQEARPEPEGVDGVARVPEDQVEGRDAERVARQPEAPARGRPR